MNEYPVFVSMVLMSHSHFLLIEKLSVSGAVVRLQALLSVNPSLTLTDPFTQTGAGAQILTEQRQISVQIMTPERETHHHQ